MWNVKFGNVKCICREKRPGCSLMSPLPCCSSPELANLISQLKNCVKITQIKDFFFRDVNICQNVYFPVFIAASISWLSFKSSCIFRRYAVNKHLHFVGGVKAGGLRWHWVWQSVGEGGHLPFIREFGSSSINPNRTMYVPWWIQIYFCYTSIGLSLACTECGIWVCHIPEWKLS